MSKVAARSMRLLADWKAADGASAWWDLGSEGEPVSSRATGGTGAEDSAVGCYEPVAVPVGGGCHPDDRLREYRRLG